MVNPYHEVLLDDFVIQILDTSTKSLLEELSFFSGLAILPGNIAISYQRDNNFKYANVSHTFYLTP